MKQQTEQTRISDREKALVLKAVADKHGELTRTLVVAEADPKNPRGVARRLASLFDWNDAEAATRWREAQAGVIIRSAEPILIQLGVIQIKAPHYVHNPSKPPGEQGYVPLMSIKSEQDVARDALDDELSRAVSALKRAYGVATALGIEEQAAAVFSALSSLGHAPAVVADRDTAAVEATV